ncbi:MAG: hypothetical protein IKD55_11150 [Sediminibacterium sp.]|nr:hypothetical protein [Sediminibacterium sp.]
MIRKNIYKWHRTTSILITIPVLLWALSGFMHPIMTSFRPKVATQYLPPQAIDTSKIKLPLQTALTQNNITVISNFRIVQMAGNYFYQIQLPNNNVLKYISTLTGKMLRNGDQLYARYLAKEFLQGGQKNERLESQQINGDNIDHDCCENTTSTIMNDTSGAKVVSTLFIEKFDDEYKNINRLLPVYKISFDRADGIRLYVETVQDRFAFAMDNKRMVFDTIFTLFHTWSWLSFLGKGKFIVEALLCLLAIATTLMGLYIFFTTKTKKVAGNKGIKARNNHRWTSLIFALFTLMFTASGAFHALEKLKTDDRDNFFISNTFETSSLAMNYQKIVSALGNRQLTNISLVKINNETYWQVFSKKSLTDSQKDPEKQRTDIMKDKMVPPPSTIYLHSNSYQPLINGERKYAAYLGSKFSRNTEKDTISLEVIIKFEGEYGFVNKRLPVWKINYPFNNKERWYVETGSGKLAAKVNDKDLIEGFSFAFLHKHHFMDFAGKNVRDFSTMFAAMSQIMLVIIGLVLWIRVRKKNKAAI